MTMEQLFSLCSGFAGLGWLLLWFLPRWRWTERLVLSGFWSLALALVYLALLLRFMPGADGGLGSIAEVRAFFGHDALLLAGWVHYLAFDLLIGVVEVREAKRTGIPHLLVLPALFLTALVGPVGFILFFIIKSVRQRKVAEVIS